ncbi:MAG: hypothetical protein A2745_01565 [Candidatus Harrisonbacteria bacterium RIFCSPHIGHO2_01_FULL_44_13]|uniref:Thymidine kinase n=1 Tax=Candidatus Harrisonbacteria bacterium RIFCSPLOWO2_01_FULL_44_18 TaxID=1798407 RepID=A0A1G1ZKU0_9BACT|nr:MAG: hypothetical protein A2745_01565 [Candidatus Harrisonbacteria bacterium RIFCSPHIGHO2_01_FULL_44_13]OGY65164.1 MAG: hypothetical protein A3A16_00525 [Candidatus Harrisonbacteria bacterium RIFCSPLOWO2_01_FULL_44_18]
MNKKITRGKLTVITGTMFSGKTDELIRRIKRLREYGGRKVIVFKPSIDTRSQRGFIESADGNKMAAHEIETDKPEKMLRILGRTRHFNVAAMDEVQFFSAASNLHLVVSEICAAGYDVIAAGLDLDFRGEPFGSTPLLMALADGIDRRDAAHCGRCKKPARLPQRLIRGKPAAYHAPLIRVGGKETYEVRCYKCHELPGKPSL